jgi:hypothetical protein
VVPLHRVQPLVLQHLEWVAEWVAFNIKWVNTNMYITELYKPHNTGYESEKDDQSVLKLSDMRKHSRLTFADLNRLRMAHDVRKVEHESKLEKITKQYKLPAAAPAGGMV